MHFGWSWSEAPQNSNETLLIWIKIHKKRFDLCCTLNLDLWIWALNCISALLYNIEIKSIPSVQDCGCCLKSNWIVWLRAVSAGSINLRLWQIVHTTYAVDSSICHLAISDKLMAYSYELNSKSIGQPLPTMLSHLCVL